MEKISKFVVFVMLVFMLMIGFAVCMGVLGDRIKKKEAQAEALIEKEIVVMACEEINGEPSWEVEADSEYASLTLLFKESIPWSEWDCYEYVLKVDGHRFTVGVQRNEKEIHFVDVEEDITGRSDYGTVTIRG